MNYTTQDTFTACIRVWVTDEFGSRFEDRVLLVYGPTKEEAEAKVKEKFPDGKIKYIEASL